MNNQFYQPYQSYSQQSPQQPQPQYQAPQFGAQTPFYSHPILNPLGLVFNIKSAQELNTIPASQGLNWYYCEPENKIYIRTVNNGFIDVKELSIGTPQEQIQPIPLDDLTQDIADIKSQLLKLSTQIQKSTKGGAPEWQI